MKNKYFKENDKLVLIAYLCYLSTKAVGYEKGSLTKSCQVMGKKYDIRHERLMPLTSFIKYVNGINLSSFRIGKRRLLLINMLKNMVFSEIEELLTLIANSEDKYFDLLEFLISEKNK